MQLADGNRASAGELIITRRNDRRLRTSASDWVKNGDRWTVLAVGPNGSLRVRHGRSGRTINLPANYFRDFVELGYAVIHLRLELVTVLVVSLLRSEVLASHEDRP